MRRIADPTVYEHLKPPAVKSNFYDRRDRSGLHDIPLPLECYRHPAQGRKAPAIRGIPIPWNGQCRRLRDMETFRDTDRLSRTYEYSVPGLSKDYLPQTEKAPQHVKLEAH